MFFRVSCQVCETISLGQIGLFFMRGVNKLSEGAWKGKEKGYM